MEGQQKTIEYIRTIDELSEEEKGALVKEVEDGEDIGIVLDKAADKLQDKLDAIFEEKGIELDENEIAQAEGEMNAEIQSAENEFGDTMKKIDKESDAVTAETDAALVAARKEDILKNL